MPGGASTMALPPNTNDRDATHPTIPLIHLRMAYSGSKLERDKGDFKKWEQGFRTFLTFNHLTGFFFSPLLSPPSSHAEPRAHSNYLENRQLAVAALISAVAESEAEFIDYEKSPKDSYDLIKARCQSTGPVKQVALVREALSTYCSTSEPLSPIITKICTTIDNAFAMGDITKDLFKCIAILNSLNDKSFEAVQSNISRALSDSTTENPYTSEKIRRVIESEDTLRSSKKQMQSHDTALLTKPSSSHNHGSHDICCTNCASNGRPCKGHKKEWCIRRGGGMEGKSIEESKAARMAARAKASGGSKSSSNTISVPFNINGKAHVAQVDPSLIQLVTEGAKQEFAGLASSSLPTGDVAWIAEAGGEPITSVDWKAYTKPTDEPASTAFTSIPQIKRAPISLDEFPFIADTGASVHITMDPNDFSNLESIPIRHIRGVGGSSIPAVGTGTVRLSLAGGRYLTLDDALYVPSATVRLLSISALSVNSNTISQFDDKGVNIYDKSNGIPLVRGRLLANRLYALDIQSTSTDLALSAQHTPDLMTWHRRLGHPNFQTIIDMAKSGLITGTPTSFLLPPKCESCVLGKQTKTPVPKMREEGPGHRATRRLGIVWVDLTGPAPVQSREGYIYIMNLVDDYSNKPWSIPLKLKSEAIRELKAWERAREVETGLKVGIYRTGHDGELSGHKMEEWLNSTGTDQQFGAPYTSAHMGRVERMHRTLMNKGRTMRISTGCPPNMWVEFYLTACHLHERTPTKSLKGATPYELWNDRKPDYSYMREIGCKAFVLIQNKHNPKIYDRSIECILVGYNPKGKEYRCYHRASGQVYSSYHVRFLESHDGHPPPIPNVPESGPSVESTTLEEILNRSTAEPLLYDDDDENILPPGDDANLGAPGNEPDVPLPIDQPAEPRRSPRIPQPTKRADPSNTTPTRTEKAVEDSKASAARVQAARAERKARVEADTEPEPSVPDLGINDAEAHRADFDHDRILAAITEMEGMDPISLDCEDEPRSWEEAKNSADAERWAEGYREELKSLKDMGVYKLIPRSEVPQGDKVRKGRPIFKIKRDENGKAVRFKVRLVFKGYEQVYGKDYTKTTSPTARMESWRILLHLASTLGWDATQIDVKTAFLYGLLSQEEYQYMEQPKGFEEAGKEDWVWCLVRGLYGMKQSGRIWNKTLNENMIGWGFTRLACESCVYYRKTDTGTIVTAVHVDDFLSIASTKEENARFKDQMRQVWTISDLGTPRFVVGIAIEWDRPNHAVHLSQTALIDKIIHQFGQKDAHPLSLPMEKGLKLRRVDRASLPKDEQDILARTPYRSLVGALLYLAISTRPDIAYAVQQLTQFVDSYATVHWDAAIKLVRYLKGTRDLKLRLGGTTSISLLGFTDSDWANCLDTRRSVGGYMWSIGSGAVSWAVRKQKTVAASSCEAEYMAAFEAAQECIWLRALLNAIGYETPTPTTILCDNNATINLSEDPLLHSRVKHVDIKYHFLRERVQSQELVYRYINTHDNVADLFTKPLERPQFLRLRALLGLV